MTIKVNVGVEREVVGFTAYNWEVTEDGFLWVLNENDEGVATFPAGIWNYVYETKDDGLPKPRVWQRIQDVPNNVFVKDSDGSTFVNRRSVPQHVVASGVEYDWGYMNLNTVNEDLAPFTEVVE